MQLLEILFFKNKPTSIFFLFFKHAELIPILWPLHWFSPARNVTLTWLALLCHSDPCSKSTLFFFLNFLFCIGVEPINNVLVVSGEQQRASAIHTHVSILSQTPVPPRLPCSIEQNSLYYTVGPYWLSILDIAVCTCPSQLCTMLGLVTQSCLTLCDIMDCSLWGSSVHGILQARILEWVASSKRSSWPRDQSHSSYSAGRFFTTEPPGKTLYCLRSSLRCHFPIETFLKTWPTTPHLHSH